MAFASIQDELSRFKRDEPFMPFDVVTRKGDHVYVGGRWLFAFCEKYLQVLDDHDRFTRIWFKNIERLEVKPKVSN